MPNRLANATSPYLLQHKDNPVDWFPWGEEAFAKARAERKPIFLSVGYASCHWCHVMERESFEDAEVAELLNRDFISVKVDREERPDVDEAYMTAVQLSSGRGGWPMSVFLTPDRKPFFAGTYFPKEDRGQVPGFRSIVRQLSEYWRLRPEEIQRAGDEFSKALSTALTREAPATFAKLDEGFITKAVQTVLADFDAENGGFGGAPKFPPHSAIELLLDYAVRATAPEELREAALGVALVTLERMALSGLQDHVGGGFHRYATDANWHLPHFEKMLYDNALLLANYVRGATIASAVEPAWAQTFMQTAHGIAAWAEREMRLSDGTFAGAIDADSEGEEGKYYVWTRAELDAVLGDRATTFAEAFGVTAEGNFEDEATRERTGANVLHPMGDLSGHFNEDLDRLLQARSSRVPPLRDDKALVGWNGLLISALAFAGEVGLAVGAARAILDAERSLGHLPHQIAGGVPSGEAYLDDYAYFAEGLLHLGTTIQALSEHEAELRARGVSAAAFDRSIDWGAEAARLIDAMVERFYDSERGGFFGTSDRHETLFGRVKPVFDQPIPSGNAVALRLLIARGDEERARQTAEAFLGWVERAPHATESLLVAMLPLAEAGVVTELPKVEEAKPLTADVRVEMVPREIPADGSGIGRGEVRIVIPEGFHLNTSEPPARWLTPTRLQFEGVKAEVTYPAGENDQYVGSVTIPFTITLPAGKSAQEFEVTISFQACTDSECMLPSEKRFDGVVLRG